jgi:4-diphosphocytidyl-2-C-methyl-D-erythritol kinase
MEKPRTLRDGNSLLQLLAATANDLEVPARAIQPAIDEVLKALATQSGVLMARMSGSGATCFALFESDAASQAAAENIAMQRPEWWVRATRIAHNAIGAVQ